MPRGIHKSPDCVRAYNKVIYGPFTGAKQNKHVLKIKIEKAVVYGLSDIKSITDCTEILIDK